MSECSQAGRLTNKQMDEKEIESFKNREFDILDGQSVPPNVLENMIVKARKVRQFLRRKYKDEN